MTCSKLNVFRGSYPLKERTQLYRRNCDKHPVDEQGRKFLELCKSSGIRILNGRMPGDRQGSFTRYPMAFRESPSTLDYMAGDEELLRKIKSFIILPHNGLSDHDSLRVTIETRMGSPTPEEPINIINQQHVKYATAEQFKMKLKSPLGNHKLAEFMNKHSTVSIDSENMCADLVKIFTQFSQTTLKATKTKNRKNKNKTIR